MPPPVDVDLVQLQTQSVHELPKHRRLQGTTQVISEPGAYGIETDVLLEVSPA